MQTDTHEPTRLETLLTLAASGLALLAMAAAGYLTPDLIAALGR